MQKIQFHRFLIVALLAVCGGAAGTGPAGAGEHPLDHEDVDGYPSAYLPKFAALYAQNEDIAGWIKIDGTKYLDMPVVQYIDNDFYERRDFTKADNQHGRVSSLSSVRTSTLVLRMDRSRILVTNSTISWSLSLSMKLW